mmetsp:Transcript_29989/g.63597  ORF Transcript_29989/g.63597 Transcript_29989/m.63597 type:complete len:470 (-) Transcript_29989:103-1512(-)
MICNHNNNSSSEIITIPITRLPTTLGKEHATKDPSFVGLKEIDTTTTTSSSENTPKLSQSMCSIVYRDAHGGKLGLYKKGRKKENNSDTVMDEKGEIDPLDGMIYKPFELSSGGGGDDNEKSSSTTPSPNEILRLPGMDAVLPTRGFFAIECTGRKIMVGGKVIKKGQFAMLKDGMPIKIASHCFYFLLPKSSTTITSTTLLTCKPPPSIKVKVTTPIKLEKITSFKAHSEYKKERESMNGNSEKDDPSPSPPPSKKPRKSEEFASSIDDKSDAQLLQLLSQKVTQSTWDHEGQRLGTTLATRVCRAAAKSSTIQTIVRDEGGVTQREIMDWMNDDNSIFKEYERMIMQKIEKKSFMMSIGKAIVRAGYTKNEYLSGRAFRWNLPEDTPLIHLSDKGGGGGGLLGSKKASEEGSGKATLANSNEEEEDVMSTTSNDNVSMQDDVGWKTMKLTADTNENAHAQKSGVGEA